MIYKRLDGRWVASMITDEGKRKYFYGKTRPGGATPIGSYATRQGLGITLGVGSPNHGRIPRELA